MFAPMGSGGDSKWTRNSEWPVLGYREEGCMSGKKCVLHRVPKMPMLEVTEDASFPDLESGEQH